MHIKATHYTDDKDEDDDNNLASGANLHRSSYPNVVGANLKLVSPYFSTTMSVISTWTFE